MSIRKKSTNAQRLSDLMDVDFTNTSNGYALLYDSVTNKFTSKPLPAGTGGGATSLGGLADVDVTTVAPNDGNVMVFQSGKWKPLNAPIMEDWIREQVILIDETPPEKISSLMVVDVDKTNIKLKWKHSPSQDVIDYVIYNGTTLLSTTTSNSVTLAGLTSGTVYNIIVKARDGRNNESVGLSNIVKTEGSSVLSMNGTSDYIVTPSLTFDAVEMTVSVDPVVSTQCFFLDARNGMPRVFWSRESNGYDNVGLDWVAVYMNGMVRRNGASNVQTNAKTNLRIEAPSAFTNKVNFMSSLTSQGWMKGKIYRAKIYNGNNVVAYYDFTQQFSGTSIPDISGNGKNATLQGGSWLAQ